MKIRITMNHRGCKGNGKLYHNYKYNLGFWRCIAIAGVHITIAIPKEKR